MSRDTFVPRLATLVPPPRFNLERYYGVLASQRRVRDVLRPKQSESGRQLKLFEVKSFVTAVGIESFRFVREGGVKQAQRAPSRIRWADLLARVFEIDVRQCPSCGGRLRVVEVVGLELGAAERAARAPPGKDGAGQLKLFAA